MRLEREAQREWKARRLAALAEDAALNVDWVTTRLCQVTDRCMQAEPIRDKEGNPTGEYRFDSSGANRSLELLGRHVGAFAEDGTKSLSLEAVVINHDGSAARVRISTANPANGSPTRDAAFTVVRD